MDNDLLNIVYSDFPHTMQGGDTASLMDAVISTPEEDVIYFASCIVAQKIDQRLVDLSKSCLQWKGYQSYLSENNASLLPKEKNLDVEKYIQNLKTTTLINKKSPLAQYYLRS